MTLRKKVNNGELFRATCQISCSKLEYSFVQIDWLSLQEPK